MLLRKGGVSTALFSCNLRVMYPLHDDGRHGGQTYVYIQTCTRYIVVQSEMYFKANRWRRSGNTGKRARRRHSMVELE